jgi:signal transduction histidine kinase
MPQMFGNLSIRPKLVALLAVPVAGTALLALAGTAAGWGDRARAGDERQAAVVAGRAVAAVHELQEERARAVAVAAGQGGGGAALAAGRGRVDRALAAYRAGAARLAPTGDPTLDRALAVAAGRLDRLAVARAVVDRRLVPAERAAAGFDAMVGALLEVAGGLTDRLAAPGPARAADLLLAVAMAKEATNRERTLLAAIPPQPGPAATGPAPTAAPGADPAAAVRAAPTGADEVLPARLTAAAAVARHELNGVRRAAGDRRDLIDRALGAPEVRGLRRLELALLQPGAAPAGGELDGWRVGSTVRAAALRRVERALAADLDEAAWAALRREERRLRDWLVLAAVAALATLAATLWLLGSAAGRTGRPAAALAAVPGLARRGQALADRQLRLLEELARDEPDHRRRQGLLGVDHLATRLRRTSETLLAMTGPDPARRSTRPVPLAMVLRAAAAEAEPQGPAPTAGRRVDLLTSGEVRVAGPAGVDLVHLLAELLDNAAAFSAPTAPIVVTAAGDGDGQLIEVADRGLGMTDKELAWANQRLAGGTGADPAGQAAGDRLGLLIVAHLAARNGFSVRLGRSPAGGITAAVRLPAALLSTPAPAAARPG